MCSCSGETPDFQSNTWQRARKTHTCVECRRDIKPGEMYQRVTVCFDGSIDSEKECAACSRLHHAYFEVLREQSSEDCAPPFGELLECVRELIRNDEIPLRYAIAASFLTPAKWEWQHIEFAQKKGAAA